MMFNPQNEDNNDNSFFPWVYIKTLLIVTVLSILALNTIYGFAMPKGEVACIDDKVFTLTSSLNSYFAVHKLQKNIMLITSSLLIDVLIIITALHWIAYSKTWRLPLSLVTFYLFRGIVQSMFQMKYPEGYLWEYPNFPSLVVSYLKTNDFFFSGHVGLPVMLALEWKNNKKMYLFYISLFVCAVEIITMISRRGHYTIDLIAGVVFALYIYELCEKISVYVDSCKWFDMSRKEDEGFRKAEIRTENENIV